MVYIKNMDYFSLSSNENPKDDFEGLSPNQMQGLLYSPFEEAKSPLSFNSNVDDNMISKVIFVNHNKILRIITRTTTFKVDYKRILT